MTDARKAKLWDVAAAFPMIGWFAAVVVASAIDLVGAHDWRAAPFARAGQFANAVFAGVLIVLFVVRRTPIARPAGWPSRAVGLLGGLAPMAILAVPRAAPSRAIMEFSSLVILLGTLASIAIVFWLGRCFSILPQARGLVTSGPYRFVRHPLYLAEIVTLFGLMWQFELPWSGLVVLCAAAAQFPRMYFEERILRETFPAYADYAARTARLAPGLF